MSRRASRRPAANQRQPPLLSSGPWPATRPSSAWEASSLVPWRSAWGLPAGVLGAPLAIILAATAVGLLMATIWCAALGQSAVAAVFGIFGTFWLSYAVLVLGLDHNWFAIAAPAALATVKLFLLTWLIIIVMLTLATLRLPSAFTAVFALVDLALLLLYLGFAQASAAGVPSSGLLKAGGYVVLVFAALGVYLFFSAAAAGTGGAPLPLGKPLQH